MKFFKGKFLSEALKLLIMIIISLCLAEISLRLLLPKEIVFNTGFTEGISAPDETFGYVYAPDYTGFMVDADKSFFIPLSLDEHGFREQHPSTNTDSNIGNVAFIGGESMMFGYGLFDKDTVPEAASICSGDGFKSHNVTWPGFLLHNSFIMYNKHINQNLNPKYAVVSVLYAGKERFLSSIATSLDYIPPQAKFAREISHGNAFKQVGTLENFLGPLFYKSFIIGKVTVNADNFIKKAYKLRYKTFNQPEDTTKIILNADEHQKFNTYVKLLDEYFSNQNTKLIIVFIPTWSRGEDFFQPLYGDIPENVQYLDAHRTLFADLPDADWIVNHHYGTRFAKKIGCLISDTLKENENENTNN